MAIMIMARGAVVTAAIALGLGFSHVGAAGQAASAAGGVSADSAQSLVDGRVADGVSGMVAITLGAGGHRFHPAGVMKAGGDVVDSLTVFEIGSVSKALTGLLLAEMVARGEVALDDEVSQYLPAEVRMPAGETRAITLLDLATHRSGLPRLPGNLLPAAAANPYATYDAARLYAFLDDHELRREPGAMYEYSNLGAGLLGHVLALRGGMSYEELVIERILEPLGLHETRLTPTASMQARLASGHNAMGAAAVNWQFDVLAGAGGWLSTAADMRRLLAAALQPPTGVLGAAFALATREHAGTDLDPIRIGLGWHLLRRGEQAIVWHNGQTAGYYAFIGYDPEAGIAAVVLSATSRRMDDVGLALLPQP